MGTAVQDLDSKVDNFFTMVMTKLELLMDKVEKMEEGQVLRDFTRDSVNDCREALV